MHTDILKAFLSIFALGMFSVVAAQPGLVAQKVVTDDGRAFTLNRPAHFDIIPAAQGMKRARFFAKAPDGRIFVTDMYNLTDNRRGAIYILDGWDAVSGRFASVIPYMTGLHNPNSVQFHTDARGQDWIYLAETEKLTRRRFTRGEEKPSDVRPEVLATFPDYGLSYKYGGWHLTRTIAFGGNGKMYVSVGSSCNSCIEKEEVRATVLEMNPDGSEKRIIARGLRNAVGLKWIDGALWAANQGSDHLGLNRPDETFYRLWPADRPTDYGWPYCHSSNGRIFPDPKLKRRSGCRSVPPPVAFFPARSSALGFDRFGREAPQSVRNSFVVALHGSSDKAMRRGYKIVSVQKGGRTRDVISGFLKGSTVNGRPCDIMKLDENSFLFTDDHHGVVYLVRRRK